MHCPKCNDPSVQPQGARSHFRQTYRCQSCQHSFVTPSLKKIAGGLLGMLVVLGLSPWWSNKILQFLVTQPDSGEPVDAIVVLGRGANSTAYRTAAAVQLWQDGRAPQIFMSGANDAPILIDVAKSMGVPDTNVSGEGCSATTWGNAFYTEMLMPSIDTSSAKPKIILITDDLHIARATIIYRNFGYEVIPRPVRLTFPAWRQHVFREFLALVNYAHKGKLQSPTAGQYEFARSVAKTRIPEWQCVFTDQAL